MFKHREKYNQQRRPAPRGRNFYSFKLFIYLEWQDDDNEAPRQPTYNQGQSKPSFIKERSQPQKSFGGQSSINTRSNYSESESSSSISLESRLLDEIIQPTGIAVKPSETLLNEYCRRAKNLNRDTMYHNIMDKITPFRQYAAYPDQMKVLIKCLYLIEAICENKVVDLFDAFEEQLQLFDEIRKTYPNNRKIQEITNHIIKLEINQQYSINKIKQLLFEAGYKYVNKVSRVEKAL